MLRQISSLPLWTDCPWQLPEGVEIRKTLQGSREIVVLTKGEKFVSVLADVAENNLPALLERL